MILVVDDDKNIRLSLWFIRFPYLCRGHFVKHCNFFSAIAINLRNISYLCTQKHAKLGGTSTTDDKPRAIKLA